jgi:hypothetical protein
MGGKNEKGSRWNARPNSFLNQKHRQFFVDRINKPVTLYRHSGMILARLR